MIENTPIYFSSGEFAQLCGVTKHTLYHYDQIGIFSPDVVGENGYRYYSPVQFDMFSVICMLKELGMPLADIRTYLDQRSPQKLIELLDFQKDKIEAKISQLQMMKELIEQKKEETEQALAVKEEEIYLQYMEEEHLTVTEELYLNNDRDVTIALANLISFFEKKESAILPSFGGILLRQDLEKDPYARYHRFYMKRKTEALMLSQDISSFTKPAGIYLVGYHRGGYHTIDNTYRRILNWAKQKKIRLSDPFYEDNLLDELSLKRYDQYLMRICVKMEESM